MKISKTQLDHDSKVYADKFIMAYGLQKAIKLTIQIRRLLKAIKNERKQNVS